MHRFDFGNNWKSFSSSISADKISEATENLKRITQEESLEKKSFLDIGCGSGVHSLAAVRLGAKEVAAFDVDPVSVQTTRQVLADYAPDFMTKVEQRSILDVVPSDEQGRYDLVYSWGVLHHTGNMWAAIKNASAFVAPDGKFVIAIYKKSPLCGFWRVEKSIYSRLPGLLRFPITSIFSGAYLLGLLLKGTNPIKYVKNYRSYRGMNFWHDMIDWLGGYPYESASPEEIKVFFDELGFRLLGEYNTAPVKAFGLFGCGCAEFVFERAGK